MESIIIIMAGYIKVSGSMISAMVPESILMNLAKKRKDFGKMACKLHLNDLKLIFYLLLNT